MHRGTLMVPRQYVINLAPVHEKMGIAVGISLLSCLQANMYADLNLFPAFSRQFAITASGYI